MRPLTQGLAFGAGLSRRRAAGVFLAGVALSLAIGTAGLLHAGPVQRLDNALLDAFVRQFASGQPARDAVVVDIDEVSLSAVGQWPWPRYRIASLIDKIAAEKPAAIALDILFPEADRSSLASIREAYRRDFGVDVAFTGVPEGLSDNDGFLGHEIARTGTIGASYFYFDHATREDAPPRPGLGIAGRTDLLALPEAPGAMTNADAIAAQTRVSGFLNSQPDADGALRRLPVLIQHRGVTHASLALAAVMHATGVPSATVESDARGLAVRVGAHRLPIDAAGNALLRFDGPPSAYASVSAVDVLSGRVRPEDLRGKLVFVGTSIVGMNDIDRTAVDARFPGLQIQAVLAQNLLQDRGVGTPGWHGAATLLACGLVGAALTGVFLASASVAAFVAASGLAVAALVAGSGALFAQAGLFVPVGAPLLAAGLLFAGCFALRLVVEKRRTARWRRQLENARQVTIESMASVAETRDPETGAHIKRTQNYVRAIAEELRDGGHHAETLTKEYIDLLFISAPLHDIGKVGVPDHILLKPGRLTDDEMAIMKQHAEFGRRIIHSTAEHIEGDNFLVVAGEIAATHHEKWDGSGYPRGLSGEAIPLSGRIMAVADVYDALISRRCYKEPFSHAHSTTLMRGMRGTFFDPAVLDAFFRIEAKILRIAADFKDEETLVAAPVSVAEGVAHA